MLAHRAGLSVGFLSGLGFGVLSTMVLSRGQNVPKQSSVPESAVYDPQINIDYYDLPRAQLQGNCRLNSLWMNAGYHDFPGQHAYYADAGAALARRLAAQANLSSDDDLVLDVGFGYGDQDMLFIREFGVRNIIGVNLSPNNVRIGRIRIKDAGLAHRVQFLVGDAVKLSDHVRAASVDAVIALESALHFEPRFEFFNQAWRALKIGGRLAITDVCSRNASSISIVLNWPKPEKKAWDVQSPASNLACTPSLYEAQLVQAGFSSVQVIDITANMFLWPGRHNEYHVPIVSLFGIQALEDEYHMWPQARLDSSFLPFLSYLLVIATK